MQSIAVAVLMAVFLVGATGLARLQAGDGSDFLNTRKMPEPQISEQRQALLIDTPSHWETVEDEPGRFVASDPDKPQRRISLVTMTADEKASPLPAAERFLDEQLDSTARRTFRHLGEPLTISGRDTALRGVQFIGASTDGQGNGHLHLLACLTLEDRYYWWVYLTDPIDLDEDDSDVLRADLRLLESVYRSARIVRE